MISRPYHNAGTVIRAGGEIGFEIDLEDSGRKVAFALKGRFDVSPAQKGLLSTVPGVLDVLEV